MDPERLRLIMFFGMLAVLSAAETVAAARPWHSPRWKRYLVHAALAFGNTLAIRFIVTIPLILLAQWMGEKGWGAARLLGLQGPAEILATIVVFDLFNYWWHRFNHQVPFLWRFHKVHHYDTHLDVTTALRFHVGELILSGPNKALWILFWGPSVLAFTIFEGLITAYSLFHHANVDFPDPVERLIAWVHITPRLHTGHHTVTIRTRDANFSTILSVWDRVFDTFRYATAKEKERIGIEEGRTSDLDLLTILRAPFLRNF